MVMLRTEFGSSTEKYYYFGDNLNSTVALVKADGTLTERYSYTAWGEPTITNAAGTEVSDSTVDNPFMFTAREIDILDSGNLKLQHNRHRVYNNRLARWMLNDSIGYVDGLNMVEYVNNNPLNMIDILGFCKCYPLFPTPSIISNIFNPYEDLIGKLGPNQTHDIIDDFIPKHYDSLQKAGRDNCVPWRAIAALIINEQSDYGSFRKWKDDRSCSSSVGSQGLGQIQPRLAYKYKVFGEDFEYFNNDDWTNTSNRLRDDNDNINALAKIVRGYLDKLCKASSDGNLGKVFNERVGASCLTKATCCSMNSQGCNSFANSKVDSCLVKALQGMHDVGEGYSTIDQLPESKLNDGEYCFDEKAARRYRSYVVFY